MARPKRSTDLIALTVKLDTALHAQALLAGAVAGQSTHSALVQAIRLGLDELRYQQRTTGRKTTGALLAVAPGVHQLRITTSDPELASLLVETLNACEEQAHQKGNTDMQPYSDKSNEPDLKAALESHRAFALEHGARNGEPLQVPLTYGHAVIQFIDAPSAPSTAVQEAV